MIAPLRRRSGAVVATGRHPALRVENWRPGFSEAHWANWGPALFGLLGLYGLLALWLISYLAYSAYMASWPFAYLAY